VGQTAKALRATWRRHYRHLLDLIFEEYASDQITATPDEAMDLMDELTERLFKTILQSEQGRGASGSDSILRFDYDAYRREAHHYAVDRFYKTYFRRKRGAPPLPTAYLDQILQLRFKGRNYVSIAEKLDQPKDKMRKQVKAAEIRWHEAVARIELIKQRSPRLVAGKTTAPGQQSKRQKLKPRTGK
jgi:hypothetical protein